MPKPFATMEELAIFEGLSCKGITSRIQRNPGTYISILYYSQRYKKQ